MSMKPIEDLSSDEIRREIAEALGWEYRGAGNWRPPNEPGCRVVPAYSTDLNAIAAAEATLSDDERLKLASALAGDMGFGWYQSNKILFATAIQRARALLRVLRGRKEAE